MTIQTILPVHSASLSDPDDDESGLRAVEDRQWIDGFDRLLRSHTAFLIAEFIHEPSLIDQAAPNVIVWLDGQFSSVGELVDACGSDGWNTSIYEAGVWQTAQQMHSLLCRLDAISTTAATAAEHYAWQLDYYEIDTAAMSEALEEARPLYGEPPYI